MNKFLLTLGCILCVLMATAQTRFVREKVGTIITNTGVTVNFSGGYGSVATPSELRFDGLYIDTVSGSLNLYGPTWFRGTGTTFLYDLTFNNNKLYYFQTPVSIFHTATNNSGDTLDANDGSPADIGFWLRTDLPGHEHANVVNNGVMYDLITGLQTYGTVTTGGCPATFYNSTLSLNISGSTVRYQWQSSADSSTWSNISGATNATYTATVTATTYYQCDITEVTSASTGYEQFSPGLKCTFSAGPGAIGGTFAVCNGSNTTLTNSTAGGTWSSSNTAVATIGSSTGLLTSVSAGTSTIAYSTGCGTDATQVITVNAIPSMTVTPTAQTVCNNANTTSEVFTSSAGGTTYAWSNNNTTIGIGASGTGGSIASFTGINTSTASAAGVFTVTPTANGCVGAVQTFTITVNPIPVMTVTPTAQTVCNNANTTAESFTSNVSGTTYTWANNNTTIGVGASGSGSSLAAFTATNTGTVTARGVFTVTPTANSCVGSVQTFTVSVNPTPIMSVTPTAQTVCNNANTSTQIFTSNVAGTTYAWSNNNVSIGIGASGSGSSIVSFTATNSGTAAAAGVFTVTPTASSCVGSVQTFTITVNPTPIMTVTPTAQTVCHNTNTTSEVFSSGVSGTTYTWNNDNTTIGIGGSGVGGSIASFTATNTGTTATRGVFTVTPNANSCVGPVNTFTITVNPVPVMTVTPTAQTVCNNANTSAQIFTSNVSGTTFAWSNNNVTTGIGPSGSGSAIASFTATNTGSAAASSVFTVTPTASSCLGSVQTFTITVNPTPIMSVTPTSQTKCHNTNTTTEVFSSNISGTTYTWANNNTTIGIGASGSGSSLASFTTTNPGSTATMGVFSVTPTANTCIGPVQTFSITVNPIPSFTVIPTSQTVCNNATTTSVLFPSNMLSGWIWNNDNTSIGIGSTGSGTGALPSFTATNTGTIASVATFTVTNIAGGCSSVKTFTITVNPTPIMTVTPTAQSACHGTNTTSEVFSSNVAGTTYAWNNNNTTIGIGASGTGGSIASFTATNTGGSATAGIFTVTPTASSCVGPVQTFTITVTPSVIMTVTPTSQTVCNGANTTAAVFTSNTGGTTYSWDNSNIAIGVSASGTGSSLASFTATNTGTTPIAGVFTVTPSAGACPVTVATFTITVNPTPIMTVTPTAQSVCNNANTSTQIFTSSVAGTTYTWNNNNTTIGIGASGSGSAIASFTATNTGTSITAGVFTVTPTANSCVGAVQNFTVTVNPTPIMTVTPTAQSVCNNTLTTSEVFSSNVSGTTYAWNNSNTTIGIGASGTGSSIASFTGTNSGTTATRGVFTVTPTANSCVGPVQTFSVTVNPTPIMTVTPTSQTVCNNANTSTQVFTSNVAGTTFTWSNDNTTIGIGASGSGSAIASFTATNTGSTSTIGTFTVTPTANSCVGADQTFRIGVNPTPIMTVTPTAQTVCNNANTTSVVFTSSVSGSTYAWNNSNTTIGVGASGTGSSISSFTATNTGTTITRGVFTVTPTANSCIGPVQIFSVTVNPTPIMTVTPTAQTVCNNANTSTEVFASSVAGTTYTWSNNNTTIGIGASGSGSAIASFTATNSGTSATVGNFTVTPTANSCPGADQNFSITVNPTPIMTVTPTAQTVCNNDNTLMEAFTSSVSGTTYTWANNNNTIGIGASGSGAFIASFTATNTGTTITRGVFTVTPTASTCVGPVQTFTVTVNPTPTFTVPSNQTVCNGNNTSAATFSGPVSGTTFAWTNDNTAIGLAASGTGNIAAFTATNSTTSQIQGIISVTPTANSCPGAAQSFTVAVNPTPSAITGVNNLCFGLTTTLSDPMTGGTWSSSNTTVATINSTSGLLSGLVAGTTTITYTLNTCITTMLFTVNSSPAPITGPTAVCTGNNITLGDVSTGGTWSTTDATVTIGSGTGIVSGITAGTATVSYSLGAGCNTTYDIAVNQTPSAIGGNSTVCLGTTSTLTNTYSGGSWSSVSTAVGTIDATTGLLGGVSAGTSTITYNISGCIVSTVATVKSTPAAIGGASMVCIGLTTTLTDADPSGTWTSASTSTATVDPSTGVVTSVAAGATTITYSLSALCVTSKSFTVNAYPSVITGNNLTCVAGSTVFSDSISGGVWISSNPSVASVSGSGTTATITGVSGGTATISYAMICDTATRVVTILGTLPPIVGAPGVCRGFNTTYTDATPGGTWSSSSATLGIVGTSGVATGITTGTSIITYYVNTGCLSTALVSVYDNSPIVGATSVCAGSTLALTDSIPGGLWTSSDPSVDIVNCNLGIVKGLSAGTSLISYTLSNGCVSTTTMTVISLTPITGVNQLCTGASSTMLNSAPGGIWSSSDVTKATIGSATGVVTGVAAGNVMISYVVGAGCTVTSGITVLTIPGNNNPGSVCVGATTTITNPTVGGRWFSSDVSVATVGSTTGIISGVSSGSVDITYNFGSTCSTVSTVAVNDVPTTVSVVGGGTSCGSATIAASGGAGGTIYFQGTTSGGTSTATPSASEVVTASGTYYFRSMSASGCWGTEGSVTVLVPAIVGPLNLCTATGATYTNSGGAATWSSSNTAVATIGTTTGVVNALSSGTTVITSTVGGCVVTANLTVSPAPAITGPNTVCVGKTIALANAGMGGTWSSSAPTIVSVNSSGVATGVAANLAATITYSFNGSCKSTFSVSVNPLGVITGPAFTCIGQTINLTDATPSGTWSSSNPSVATIPSGTGTVTGVGAGTTIITYTTPLGCFTTAPVTIKVLSPTTGPNTVCASQSVTLANATPGGTWSTSAPTIATVNSGNGIVVGVAGISVTLSAPISYTLGSGCITVYNVTVNPAPASGGATTVCQGATATVTNPAFGGVWSTASTSIATIGTNGVVTGVGGGLTTVSYTLPSGCAVTSQFYVNPVAPISGPTSVCLGQSMVLTNSAGAGTWSTSAPTVATVGSSSGVVTGIAGNLAANITYTFCTGCKTYQTVTVAQLSAISGPTTVCQGNTITLTNAGIGGTWSSSATGIATVGTNGVVTGVTPGAATISYAISPSCSAVYNITVNSSTPISGPASVCKTQTITLSNATAGGTWVAGTVTFATIGSSSGVVSGVSPGVTGITYTNPGGCKSFYTTTVLSLNTITLASSVCQNATTLASYLPVGGTWSSGATGVATIGTNGTVTGVAAGTSVISYSVANGCVAMATINVNPVPVISGPSSVCKFSSVTLSSSIAGGTWTTSSGAITLSGTAGTVYGSAAFNGLPISYTAPTGCKAGISFTVNAIPAAPGAITGPSSVSMSGATITLGCTPTGGSWASYNPAIASVVATTGVVSGVSVGTTIITYYTVPNAAGCTNNNFKVITVGPSAPQHGTTTGVMETAQGTDIAIMPNPNKGTFIVKGSFGTIASEEVILEVTNMLGQTVYHGSVTTAEGKINEQIILNNNLASGTYMLILRSSSQRDVFHFVIE